MKRIALFGGTFNPIHMGHIKLAEYVYRDFQMDEMVLIPSKNPPHKEIKGASEQDRLNMVKLAAEFLGDGFTASDYEINLHGVSYSYRTIKHWRDKFSESVLFFVAGSDIFTTIGNWGRWEQIFGLTNFIVVNREGVTFDEMLGRIPKSLLPKVLRVYDAPKFNEKFGNILLYSMPPVLISSTNVRVNITQDMLLGSVYDYILKRGLYSENFIG